MTAPLVLEISPLSLHNFTPQQGWMMWELRELDRRQRTEATQKQLAQKSLEPVKEQFQKRKPKVEVKVRVAAGNSAVQNWSPYPDRALDARVIRYPMPRSAAHGK